MGRPTVTYHVRWSRGITALELVATPQSLQLDASGATGLAQRIDGAEASRAPSALPSGNRACAGHRVSAGVSSHRREDGSTDESTRACLGRTVFLPPLTILPADDVLNSPNPQQRLQQLDVDFQQVGTVQTGFVAASTGASWNETVTVDETAAGAMNDLQGFVWSFIAPPVAGWKVRSLNDLTPPLQLGDATRAAKSLFRPRTGRTS